MTLQVSNIAGDGRQVVKPRDFPRHEKVYAPQKNGDSHKTRVGFETRSFFPCVREVAQRI